MPRARRLIDRIADGSVLGFPALGALGLMVETAEYGAPTSDGAIAFVILAGVACVLHAWFRAEDRWRRRRLLRAARRKRARHTLFAA